jgi:hypothetical protein
VTAIVRRKDKYVSGYIFQPIGRYRFSWTKDIETAEEYGDDFAALISGMVGGKTIPVVKEAVPHYANPFLCDPPHRGHR